MLGAQKHKVLNLDMHPKSHGFTNEQTAQYNQIFIEDQYLLWNRSITSSNYQLERTLIHVDYLITLLARMVNFLILDFYF